MAGIEAGIINLLIGPKLVDNFSKQLSGDLEKQLLPAAENAGKKFSEKLSDGLNKAGKSLTKNLTAPLLAVGALAIKAGDEIDKAFDNIRVSTGATGETLLGLQDAFRNVAKSVSAPFEETSEVISTLNIKLGLTKEPLEALATQILNILEITGEAADTDLIADFFNTFSIGAEDQSEILDKLFIIQQKTGIGFNDLLGSTIASAAQFQTLGFSALEAAGFVGNLEKNGANAGAVLAGLNKSIAASVAPNKAVEKAQKLLAESQEILRKSTLDLQVAELKYQEIIKNPKAKQSQILDAQNDVIKLRDTITLANQDIQTSNETLEIAAKGSASSTKEFFQNTVDNIKSLLASGDEEQAQSLTKSVFGAKGFTETLKQIKEGTFDVKAFTESVINSKETINGLANETRDWREELAIARNAATVAFEPLANIILPALSSAFEAITPKIEKISENFNKLTPETQKLILIVGGIAAAIGPGLLILAKIVTAVQSIIAVVKLMNLAFLANPIVLITAAIIAATILIVKNFDSIKAGVIKVWEGIKLAFTAGIDFIKRNWQAITLILTGPFGAAALLIIKNIDKIKGAATGLINFFTKTLPNAIISAANFIKSQFEKLPAIIQNIIKLILKIPGLNIIANIASGVINIGKKILGRAEGGPINANEPYIVGEKGPELIIPKMSGTVIPNNILTGMIGQGSAIYNVTINNPITEPSSASIPAALRRANLLRSNA